ncbi:hypothetical protein HU200_065791 [Digitaria exilis]|uniref:BPM/SPOP BACK domain-containing protein n=1 Tax=Digitaria exilis TaxID=1010633 RepID=A0A835DX73_9POAL|nr:hypothetical protein HU200_065791 [Digitaria exilis]
MHGRENIEPGSFELKNPGVEAVAGDFLRRCSLGDGADDIFFLVGGYKFHIDPQRSLPSTSPHSHQPLPPPPPPGRSKPCSSAPPRCTASSRRPSKQGRSYLCPCFEALLRFVYGGVLPGDGEIEMLRSLVAAADTFGMERLKLACLQKLSESVSVETVVATLSFAQTHSCPELRKKCIDFLMEEENLCKAAVSEGYVQLMLRFPSVADELRERLFFVPRLESSPFEEFGF